MEVFENAETEWIFGFDNLRTKAVLGCVKPDTFSDLMKIDGVMHSVGAAPLAEILLRKGVAGIKDIISCRDDIFIELTERGIERHMAYRVMNNVRGGQGLSSEMEYIMKSAGIPEWYIMSCKLIDYVFPKAHCAEYVRLAWQLAYYKAHFPVVFESIAESLENVLY